MIQSDYELIKSAHETSKGTILYFHGGGFIASTPRDLPKYQIEYLKDFDILLIDYPLAPQNGLKAILESVESLVEEIFQDNINLKRPIFFYGRSAGAYIASYVYARRKYLNQVNVSGLILFYGYYHFEDEAFSLPSKYYQGKSRMNEQSVKQLVETKLTLSSRMNRTLVYMYAREKGLWLNYLGLEKVSFSDYNLESSLSHFPPTFLATSMDDPDVNVEFTKQMVRKIKEVTVFYSQSEDHMFDQTENDETRNLFSSIRLFLHTTIRREVTV